MPVPRRCGARVTAAHLVPMPHPHLHSPARCAACRAQALPAVGFNQLQALEDLDLDLCDCGGVTPALAALGHLTRLRLSEANFFEQVSGAGWDSDLGGSCSRLWWACMPAASYCQEPKLVQTAGSCCLTPNAGLRVPAAVLCALKCAQMPALSLLQEAPPGAYLGRLRQLEVTGSPTLDRAASWQLPAALEGATCLEKLDLLLAGHVFLRGAEDAALLSRLPALRQVVLPLLQGRYSWQYSPRGEARQAAVAQALRLGLPGVEVFWSNGEF